MAFLFPTRRPDALFFPTLHVHDGKFHPTAEFDHVLYFQGTTRPFRFRGGPEEETTGAMTARECLVRAEATGGLVEGDRPLSRVAITGRHLNADTWIPG
jgi:hypothetical protein